MYQASNFEAAGAVAKIGLSLKLIHRKHIDLSQIGGTHCCLQVRGVEPTIIRS